MWCLGGVECFVWRVLGEVLLGSWGGRVLVLDLVGLEVGDNVVEEVGVFGGVEVVGYLVFVGVGEGVVVVVGVVEVDGLDVCVDVCFFFVLCLVLGYVCSWRCVLLVFGIS